MTLIILYSLQIYDIFFWLFARVFFLRIFNFPGFFFIRLVHFRDNRISLRKRTIHAHVHIVRRCWWFLF